jgi:sensor c-di-GMP phosphodiesterase-like protein
MPGNHTQIVQTIVTLAHGLKMNVIAEGIEMADQLARLQAMGCEYGQGYFFARPLDSQAAEALLAYYPETVLGKNGISEVALAEKLTSVEKGAPTNGHTF